MPGGRILGLLLSMAVLQAAGLAQAGPSVFRKSRPCGQSVNSICLSKTIVPFSFRTTL